MKERGSSLLGAGLVVPWCCVAPAVFSLRESQACHSGSSQGLKQTCSPIL